jgi:regulator of protease activity HflC (stomatin/prohibitin superfamily)
VNFIFFSPVPASKPALLLLCAVFSAAFLAMIWVASAIRVVPEYQRLVVFRLGRYLGIRGPGLVLLIPALDRGIKVDLREQERGLPGQSILTGDKYPVTVETRWHYKIIDPMASVLEVGNFEKAAQEQIVSNLREEIGKLNIQDVLAKRQAIAEEVCSRLNEAAGKWGVQATKFEISEITLPREAQEAVQRGRTRQAALLGSVGEAKSPVYTEGAVELYGETWNANSPRPIPPGKKVRVSRVVLEVEEL